MLSNSTNASWWSLGVAYMELQQLSALSHCCFSIAQHFCQGCFVLKGGPKATPKQQKMRLTQLTQNACKFLWRKCRKLQHRKKRKTWKGLLASTIAMVYGAMILRTQFPLGLALMTPILVPWNQDPLHFVFFLCVHVPKSHETKDPMSVFMASVETTLF